MPIRIDDQLPAHKSLENENVFVMTEFRAKTQDIRPLKILLLNLMPTKIATETQILRLLSNTPLQVDVDLLHTATHKAKNVSDEHLTKFYNTFDEIKNNRYDGMIVTGAPVEKMSFEEVGTSFAKFSSGAKRTYIPPSTSAGVLRLRFITDTASKNISPMKRFSVFSRTSHSIASTLSSEVLTRFSMCPIRDTRKSK